MSIYTQQSAERLQAVLFTIGASLFGVALVALTKKVLEIDSDAAFLLLLVLPVAAYLGFSGRLREFTWLGFSAKLEAIDARIEEIGQYEPERGTYHAKLDQVIQHDGDDFCLIYSDIDSLRDKTREIYLNEKSSGDTGAAVQSSRPETRSPSVLMQDRRTEKEIRRNIIRALELTLTDAAVDNKVGKYEVFSLEEPDIAMIVRRVGRPRGVAVAQAARQSFVENMSRQYAHLSGSWSATLVVLPVDTADKKPRPRDIDRSATGALRKAKDRGRGDVYVFHSGRLEEASP